jgi:FAD/FMN-containing dehydrogenase
VTAAVAKASADPHLIENLRQLMGGGRVITELSQRSYYSTDLSAYPAVTAAAVIQPGSVEELAQAVKLVAAAGYALIPRGGGMSYTKGYVPERPESVLFDMRSMNGIVEINTDDMYVTVEAGCTWKQLYEALQPRGVRTPYYGPLSGMYATVGGTLSQNSLFWGSGIYHTAADSCIGLEVVLANGDILHTGSGAHRHSNPFYRHFGPDLTGIFTADTGAFGIKTKITLRLIETPAVTLNASFGFATIEAMLDVQIQLARKRIASECYGFDPFYNEVMKGLGFNFEPTKPGSAKPGQIQFTLHVSIDAIDKASAEGAMAIVRDCCASDGVELDSAVPAAFKAQPFGGVRTILLGAEGELWLPVHGFFPLSKTKAAARATERFFADNADLLRRHGIKTSYLTCFSGSEFVIEPSFYWFDELGKFRLDLIEPEYRDKWKTIMADRETREVVLRLREELRDLFFQHGACSVQIAKFYPYRDAMNNPHTWNLLEEIKRLLDPKGIMNPGALGLR